MQAKIHESRSEFRDARDLYMEAADRFRMWKNTADPETTADHLLTSIDERIQDFVKHATNLTQAYTLSPYHIVRGSQEFSAKYTGEFPTREWQAVASRAEFFELLDQAGTGIKAGSRDRWKALAGANFHRAPSMLVLALR